MLKYDEVAETLPDQIKSMANMPVFTWLVDKTNTYIAWIRAHFSDYAPAILIVMGQLLIQAGEDVLDEFELEDLHDIDSVEEILDLIPED